MISFPMKNTTHSRHHHGNENKDMDYVHRHKLKKINPDSDEYEIVLYLDDHLTEFSDELGRVPKKSKDILTETRQLIRNRYPNIKINLIRVIIGGIVVTSIPLMGGNSSAAEESEISGTTSTSTQTSISQSIYYTVLQGDTLWNLSRKFNTSIVDIKQANRLTSDGLMINQRLIIPKAFHTVASGDYLSVLAKKYGTTIQAIKEANGLISDGTRIGQMLIIPSIIGGESQTVATIPVPPVQVITYTVISGDSLSVIAKRFDTTIEALRSDNHLTSDLST